jgi:hypothetical protein
MELKNFKFQNHTKELERMIEKYIAVIVLVVGNVLGLSTLSNIENRPVDKEPPSSLVLLTPLPASSFMPKQVPTSVVLVQHQTTNSEHLVQYDDITFKHGDVSWLPRLADQAGWPKDTWPMLKKIILRESGGCPNRKGGDKVDKNCIITGVSEWNHRSDTGLMQINGINYNLKRNKWAAVCRQLSVCTQEPLLDPLTNLKAAKVLYDIAGWDPWDPCAWGPEYAKRCTKTKKP